MVLINLDYLFHPRLELQKQRYGPMALASPLEIWKSAIPLP